MCILHHTYKRKEDWNSDEKMSRKLNMTICMSQIHICLFQHLSSGSCSPCNANCSVTARCVYQLRTEVHLVNSLKVWPCTCSILAKSSHPTVVSNPMCILHHTYKRKEDWNSDEKMSRKLNMTICMSQIHICLFQHLSSGSCSPCNANCSVTARCVYQHRTDLDFCYRCSQN